MALSAELLAQAAQDYGTPLFVYDLDVVQQRYRDLFSFITWPKLRVFYAMKANYNVAILRCLQEAGASLDTVSPGEVHLARLLGYPAEQPPPRKLYDAERVRRNRW